jgi:hypothetical protein
VMRTGTAAAVWMRFSAMRGGSTLTTRSRFSTGGLDPCHRRVSGAVVAVLAAVAAATFVASASGSAGDHHATARMLFHHRMTVATACFAVTNPADRQSMLYGLRYSDTPGPN